MCTIRHFEYMADKLYAAGKVHGTMHLSAGQEAVAAGISLAVAPDDYLINHHRGHGHFIAKNADINLMMAEFLGKDTGYNRAAAAQCTSLTSSPTIWVRMELWAVEFLKL
jgi:TPP-dependent pyruvate/acetoin dehydrogenase alpha subunit